MPTFFKDEITVDIVQHTPRTDPSLGLSTSPTDGAMWYDSISKTLRYLTNGQTVSINKASGISNLNGGKYLYPANPPFVITKNCATLRAGSSTFQGIVFGSAGLSSDQYSRFRLVNLTPPAGGTGGFVGAVLRGSYSPTLGPSYYYIVLDSTTGLSTDGMGTEVAFSIFRVKNNVNSGNLFGFPFPFLQPGDDFIVQIQGSTFSMYQNGVLSSKTFTDPSPLLTGSPGFFIENDSTITDPMTNCLDNWSGGDLSVPYGPPFYRTVNLGTVTISQAATPATFSAGQYQTTYTYTATTSVLGVAPAVGMRLVVSGFTESSQVTLLNGSKTVVGVTGGITSGTLICSPAGPVGTVVQAATGILQMVLPE